MGMPFLGAEELILLGIPEATLPIRSALRKIGVLLRRSAAAPDRAPEPTRLGRRPWCRRTA